MTQFVPSETAQILAEMQQAGIDLSQPLQVDFIAAFEFKDKAESAADTIKQQSFAGQTFSNITVETAEVGGGYDLIASLTMTLEESQIDAIDAAFTAAVEKLRGYSDGWGVGV